MSEGEQKQPRQRRPGVRFEQTQKYGKRAGADHIAGNIGHRWRSQLVTLLHRSCSSPDFAFSLIVRLWWRRRWQHLPTLPRNSANGAVADVTLDNEGPETNNGSGYKYMRAEEKAKLKSRRLERINWNPESAQGTRNRLLTASDPSTGTILHETIARNRENREGSDVIADRGPILCLPYPGNYFTKRFCKRYKQRTNPPAVKSHCYPLVQVPALPAKYSRVGGATRIFNEEESGVVPEDLSGDRYNLTVTGGPKLVREQWSKCGLTDSLNFAGRSAVVALPLFVVLRLLQCFRRNMIRRRRSRHIVPNTSRIAASPSDLPPQLWKWTARLHAEFRIVCDGLVESFNGQKALTYNAEGGHQRKLLYVREQNEGGCDSEATQGPGVRNSTSPP
ncbi:hypothetical protein V8E52_005590 [Russula decolorans]